MDAFRLPDGWGVARLERATDAPPASGAARAYDHLGVRLAWTPGPACRAARAVACDLEHAARFEGPADPRTADPRLGPWDWVATEVVAKLARVPVLALVRDHGVVASSGRFALCVPLARYGADGEARVWLAASPDGRRIAGFGMSLPARAGSPSGG